MNVVNLLGLMLVLGVFAFLAFDIYQLHYSASRHFQRKYHVINVITSAAIAAIAVLLVTLQLMHNIHQLEAQCHAHSNGHPSHSSP